MWPFNLLNRKSRTQRIEECEHEWEETVDEFTHPNRVYFEDGKPYVNRLTARNKMCKKCVASELIEQKEEKVYLSIEEIEQIE